MRKGVAPGSHVPDVPVLTEVTVTGHGMPTVSVGSSVTWAHGQAVNTNLRRQLYS